VTKTFREEEIADVRRASDLARELGPLDEEAVGNGPNEPTSQCRLDNSRDLHEYDDRSCPKSAEPGKGDTHRSSGGDDRLGIDLVEDAPRQDEVSDQVTHVPARRTVREVHALATEQGAAVLRIDRYPST
jgi:hypothetical protein